MSLHALLLNAPDDTTVLGDLDAFIAYVENGQALQDWRWLQAEAMKELNAFLRIHNHSWRHIVYSESAPPPASQTL
jgi:hypothetical protein